MIAKMAKVDLGRLRAEGFKPTDDQVVRLNDLAVRIELGKNNTVANMPRVATAGNVTVYEPTYAALEWWHNFGRDAAWTTRGKLDTYYFMLAHATDPDAFAGLDNDREINRAVKRWRRGVYATDGELWRAVLWVRHGEVEDSAERSVSVGDSMADEESLDRLYRMIIAASGALSVSPASLRCETTSTLVALLIEANLNAKIPMKASVARDYIAYQQTIKEIEDGSRSEVIENGR